MGMFDTFHYVCPFCDKDTCGQTKLGECGLLSLSIGCEFPINGATVMKDPCEHCGEHVAVEVNDNIIMNFKKPHDTMKQEGRWGRMGDAVHAEDGK